MELIHVLILSIVEGLTEFLPISSTGHLILASRILNLESSDFLKTFEIAIQLGAILAVIVLYSKKLLTRSSLVKKLIVAFAPSAVVGFILYPLIKGVLLGSSLITLNALFWGGIALIIIEKFFVKREIPDSRFQAPTYRQALVIGTFQAISVIPGVSRAAATIIGGRLAGLDRKTATEFSFLLAVPTMFAATGLDIYKSRSMLVSAEISTLALGMFFSFIFAMLAVKFLIGYVKNHDFTAFGIYRILLAVAFWIFVR